MPSVGNRIRIKTTVAINAFSRIWVFVYIVYMLGGRVFTKFRILEISYISNVFLYFVYYSKVATISRK
jgi:hypothetical protein